MKNMPMVTIVFNCLFLYWFRAVYSELLQETKVFSEFKYFTDIEFIFNEDKKVLMIEAVNKTADISADLIKEINQTIDVAYYFNQITNFVISVVIIEHLGILIKSFIIQIVGDKPMWVKKHQLRVEEELNQLQIENTKHEGQKKIDELNKIITQRDEHHKQVINRVTNDYNKVISSYKALKQRQDD